MIREISANDTLAIRQQVLWPHKSLDDVRVDNDNEGRHYGYYDNHKLVSVISVFIKDKKAQFRKFATLSEYQGRGYGGKLFEYMLRDLEELDLEMVWCNARVDACGFYERFGFVSSSEELFFREDIAYRIMEKRL